MKAHPAQFAKKAHGDRFEAPDPKRGAAALQAWIDLPAELRDHAIAQLVYLQIQQLELIEQRIAALAEVSARAAAANEATAEILHALASSMAGGDEPGGGTGERSGADDPADDDRGEGDDASAGDLEIDDPTEEQP